MQDLPRAERRKEEREKKKKMKELDNDIPKLEAIIEYFDTALLSEDKQEIVSNLYSFYTKFKNLSLKRQKRLMAVFTDRIGRKNNMIRIGFENEIIGGEKVNKLKEELVEIDKVSKENGERREKVREEINSHIELELEKYMKPIKLDNYLDVLKYEEERKDADSKKS